MREKGYVQVYTGNGKGKTTAAFGVALRAVGAGYKVYIGQFMKQSACSAVKVLQQLGEAKVRVEQYGNGGELSHQEETLYHIAAKKGLEKARSALCSGAYDIVILDEINVALHFRYLESSDVLQLIDSKPINTELILTGRNAASEILDKADLITEMKEVRHYYRAGVLARTGIEK